MLCSCVSSSCRGDAGGVALEVAWSERSSSVKGAFAACLVPLHHAGSSRRGDTGGVALDASALERSSLVKGASVARHFANTAANADWRDIFFFK